MARRKTKALIPHRDFFCRPVTCDPVGNILAATGNILSISVFTEAIPASSR